MTDRSITFLFVAVWIGVGSIWIILDWLGNPNRGTFRPAGRVVPRSLRDRWADHKQRRQQEDAAIRYTLRDRYGRSSLRLFWNDGREDLAQAADAQMVTDPLLAGNPPVPELQYEPLLLEADLQPEPQPKPIRGWKVGDPPLALTRAGTTPTAATIRSRVWKNIAAGSSDITADTARRLRAGKPPRRPNPPTRKNETAKVDLESALPYWPGESTDEFTLD